MNTHVTSHRGTVALVGLAPPDLDGARDAVVLAGARVCSDLGQASLILASASAPVPEGVPCVRVGQGGQVRLPGDTALLVSLIAEASCRTRRSGAVWVVAGIAGGVGVTRVVRLLARERGRRRGTRWGGRRGERGTRRERVGDAVVVDASGSVPGVALAGDYDVPGVRWADLDASEDSYLPSLRDHLPVVGGVRALVGDSRGVGTADDPRVVAACRSLDAPLVVDAGRWDARAARCASAIYADALVLVTHGDLEGAAALSATCAALPPPCPAITLVSAGERWGAGLRACAPGPILRAPTRTGWDLRALMHALESASSAHAGEAASSPGEFLGIEARHA
ncbi:MAG: hypothetical protein KHZ63_09940 [Actinomyces sp.]|nr:hypothetical protein [Actinomyces sp.]